jgi:hypothetical protein
MRSFVGCLLESLDNIRRRDPPDLARVPATHPNVAQADAELQSPTAPESTPPTSTEGDR